MKAAAEAETPRPAGIFPAPVQEMFIYGWQAGPVAAGYELKGPTMPQRTESQKASTPEGAPPAGAEAGSPWLDLNRGDAVVVELGNNQSMPGLVDAAAEDRSVLWVQLDEGQGRRLFHCQDGVGIRRRR
jgi:hypothetical protein